MTHFKIACIASILLGIAACKTAKNTAAVTPVYEEILTEESYRKLIKDKELYNVTTELVQLDSARVNKDTLHVYTKKLQACDAENLKLVWNGSFAKSLPPQATVKLLLINDPSCKEEHRFHITYNIAPLWTKKDSAGTDSLLLKLPGLNNGMIKR
jgi:hypothetical protein